VPRPLSGAPGYFFPNYFLLTIFAVARFTLQNYNLPVPQFARFYKRRAATLPLRRLYFRSGDFRSPPAG
jgi:hypothetical protein